MRNFLTIVFVFVGFGALFGQYKQEYIYEFAEIAVSEMEHSGIPASITLAQGILESGSGRSELARMSNNHFGIKCHKSWKGKSVRYDDDAKNECFRHYKNASESFRDHSEFLMNGTRYSGLFKLNKYDYKAWARGLKSAGYATSPTYASKLIRIIEEERLYAFDYMETREVVPYVQALKRDPNTVYTASTSGKSKKRNTSETRGKKRNSRLLSSSDNAETANSRSLFYQNNIKTVWAQKGDSPEQLARLYGVKLKHLRKYNEWDQFLSQFEAGMKVYLQPKRGKSQDKASLYHTVSGNETMYAIAQYYGIKTESLYKINRFTPGMQPATGEVINLRVKRKNPPKQRVYGEVQTVQRGPSESPPAPVRQQPTIAKEVPNPSPPRTPNTAKELPPPATQPEVGSPSQPSTGSNDQSEGRAIIYQPTPEVNKRPVEVYVPPEKVPRTVQSNKPIIHNEPVAGTGGGSASGTSHTVVKGDTLWGLSKKYGVSVAQLKAWNSLSNNNISIGQRLKVKQ